MLNNINERGLSKHNNVRVRNYRGSTSEDLKDFAIKSDHKKTT